MSILRMTNRGLSRQIVNAERLLEDLKRLRKKLEADLRRANVRLD
jgi:ABC-type transporter Mla subunit MlaD